MHQAERFAKFSRMRAQASTKRLIVTTILAIAAFLATITVRMRGEFIQPATPAPPAARAGGISTVALPMPASAEPGPHAAQSGAAPRLAPVSRPADPAPAVVDQPAPLEATQPAEDTDETLTSDASLRSDRAALHSARSH
jgi:hypothetical protein